MMIEHAIELQISRLYHYQPFNADWIRRLIFYRKIRFSNPKNFHDPWDCRPYFHIPSANDPQGYERCIQWFDAVARKRTNERPVLMNKNMPERFYNYETTDHHSDCGRGNRAGWYAGSTP